MSFLFKNCLSAALFSLVLFSACPLLANPAKAPENTVKSSAMEASEKASLAWLSIVDKGHYPESWNELSIVTKVTMPKDEWVNFLSNMRKSLGRVVSREMIEQRPAKNPHKLPQGDYMVIFYKTVFSGKATTHELVTLFLEDGVWKVLTYQIG
ncbi:MAG: DUF4019 domain-containing protein [Parachlamydiaceae bacterium]